MALCEWDLHETCKTILQGLMDPESPLGVLRGHRDVLGHIHSFLQLAWQEEVLDGVIAARQEQYDRRRRRCYDINNTALAHVSNVKFPVPTGRFVNMMPFVMNNLDTLPPDLRSAYGKIINECVRTLQEEEQHKVGYLTVHESTVTAGESHRRPGLHSEGFVNEAWATSAWRRLYSGECMEQPHWHHWGFGHALRPGVFSGGIFMASNVDNSCNVYDLQVPPEVVGPGGDLEHLRPTLDSVFVPPAQPRYRQTNSMGDVMPIGPANWEFDLGQLVEHPISLQKGELYWITDRTPHESVPLKHSQSRSFFRLVTSGIDMWYSKHSTPNPLGTQPAAHVVTHDKFTGLDEGEDVSASSGATVESLEACDLQHSVNQMRLDQEGASSP